MGAAAPGYHLRLAVALALATPHGHLWLSTESPYIKTFLRRDAISLSHSLRVSGERSHSSGGCRYPKASVLCQPRHEKPIDQIPKARETGDCSLHHSGKLMHYFQTLPVIVLNVYPLRSVIKNPKATGRISVGLGTEILRTQIRANDSDQRPSLIRLHY